MERPKVTQPEEERLEPQPSGPKAERFPRAPAAHRGGRTAPLGASGRPLALLRLRGPRALRDSVCPCRPRAPARRRHLGKPSPRPLPKPVHASAPRSDARGSFQNLCFAFACKYRKPPASPMWFSPQHIGPVARGLGLQALEQPRDRARPRGFHLAETICLGLVLPQPLPCKQQVGAGRVGIGATPGRPCGLHCQWPLAESAWLARRPPNLESPPSRGCPPGGCLGIGGGGDQQGQPSEQGPT